MRCTSSRLGWLAFVTFVGLPVLLASWLVLGTSLFAQQAELSDGQKIRQLQFERNACDMTLRDLREKLASELRQTLERAEKAEAALKLAQEELLKAPAKASPAPVEKPKE